MGSEWIKWTKGLAGKREVMLIAAALGRDRHEIAGRLMVLWEWCAENVPAENVTEAGNASVYIGERAAEFLDEVMGLSGMAREMAKSEVGWLVISGSEVVFPRYAKHNGRAVKARGGGARRAKVKESKIPESLDELDFRIVWEEWKRERAARRKPLTERAEKMQLESLVKSGLGVEKAIECVRLSIENGWQGLFPERFAEGGKGKKVGMKTKGEVQDDYFQRMLEDCHEGSGGAGAVEVNGGDDARDSRASITVVADGGEGLGVGDVGMLSASSGDGVCVEFGSHDRALDSD